jgi:hypothetical protein
MLSELRQAYGIELMVKKTQGKLNGWFSYTYSRTQLRQNNGPVEIVSITRTGIQQTFDKPHDLK